jgi:hypothetical protein
LGFSFKKLDLGGGVKGVSGAEETAEFEVSDDGFENEGADIGFLTEIVTTDVKGIARGEQTGDEVEDGLGCWGVAEGEVFEGDGVVGGGEDFAKSGKIVASSATDFLLIIFEGFGEIEMDDAADV